MSDDPTPRVTLPAASYPHIIDLIFANADSTALRALRTVCKSWEDKADSLLAHHVWVDPTKYGEPIGYQVHSASYSLNELKVISLMVLGDSSSLTAASQVRYARILGKVKLVDVMEYLPSGASRHPGGSGYLLFRGMTNVDTVRYTVKYDKFTLFPYPVPARRVIICAILKEVAPDFIPLGPLQHGVNKLVVTIIDDACGERFETKFHTPSVMWPASLRQVVFIYDNRTDHLPDDTDDDDPSVPTSTTFECLLQHMAVSIPQIKFTFVNMENATGTLVTFDDTPDKSEINSKLTNFFVERLKGIFGGDDPDSVDKVIRNSVNFCSQSTYMAAIGDHEYSIETGGD